MRICLFSDIHLELHSNGLHSKELHNKKFRSNSDLGSENVLILAGDIGDPTTKVYQDFLTEMSKYYAKIFIVAGNHEYFRGYRKRSDCEIEKDINDVVFSMDETDACIDKFTKSLPNVYFMQRNSIIYNRVRFLGCTLWTRSNLSLSQGVNDYTYIPDFTVNRCEELHARDVKWLTGQLNLDNDGTYDKTIVITHHIPSEKLINEKYHGNPKNILYCDNLDHLVIRADIWVCGHTHMANHITIEKCECYTNPIGYIGEISNYNPNFVVEV